MNSSSWPSNLPFFPSLCIIALDSIHVPSTNNISWDCQRGFGTIWGGVLSGFKRVCMVVEKKRERDGE
ncbi:hypothetical protein Tco_1113320 [Tanacetum coccineum]|uniref:Uncharacterized protein n=1 Tax=Tanacetum coccineum TaxID=301880 RepID=A0ABQ5IRT7_9ASTR